jgi:epoxyqueuosine reductase
MRISTSKEAPLSPRDAITATATALGFAAIGFTSAKAGENDRVYLQAFLADGRHGDMGWMEETVERRSAPTAMWPDAKSAIVLGVPYTPEHDPLDDLARKENGVISVYARGKDYHDVIKKRLKALARYVVETFGGEVKVFVDTAPLMEKPLAQRAGLGWQGKHTNLVSREAGSWLFLGSVLTTLDLDRDGPEADHCGSCRACLDICPTRAFPAPYQLDARRCISYLTIEHKGHIPAEFRAPIANRIYGCDDCLAVCPWNKFAAGSAAMKAEPALAPREALETPHLADLAALDDAAFRSLFAGTAVKRIGRDRFIRNVLIAIGNSGAPGLIPAAERHLEDPSPLVRAMAVWALGRLAESARFEKLKEAYFAAETDPDVVAEWLSGAGEATGA